MNLIDISKRKTSFLKRFSPIKYALEKESSRTNVLSVLRLYKSKGDRFSKLIDLFRNELHQQFSNNELEKLKKLDMGVPENAVIILLDFMDYPLVGYKIH